MRRTSLFLALAAILLTAGVGFTYWLRLKSTKSHLKETPHVDPAYEAVANRGWRESKDDPVTNRPMMRAEAASFRATHDPYTFELKDLSLQLFNKKAGSYTLVKAGRALFDDRSGIMKSDGPVTVVMNIPSAVPVTDAKTLAKHVHIETTGLVYETKSGKASTDQLVRFVFPQGGGQAVGADYDPNLRILHLKSAVSLDWIGEGPVANKLHVETSDLVYKELEQKIYLSPWSKMQRQTLTIQAQNSVVTLDDGHLHQIDSVAATGEDNRNGRLVQYSAANMTALFNEDGALTEIIGDKDARISSAQKNAKTTVTGDRADLTFEVETEMVGNREVSDSQLHAVTADGHAVAISQPLPVPGVLQGDTRLLRSNHILLTMRPGGQEVQEINSPTKSNLEFKPNRSGLPHRTLDAAKLRVLYGDNSYVQSLIAADVKTRTDKPPGLSKGSDGKPPPPSYTWSDEMLAQFKPGSNEIQSIDQKGHFRYEQGDRKASSESAQLIQDVNRITLKDKAHVLDNTGSTYADLILMDQANGDMDATGHVRSTRLPDKKQKPGTSMLDATESMQAQAHKMVSTDENTKIVYTGSAVVWQGANRVSADVIAIDRDEQSLHAQGNVVSELVDNRSNKGTATQDAKTVTGPVFTVVRAPDLVYHDDTRIALYTGGVTLVRDKMTVTSDTMRAFLTPKTDQNDNQSSLDHAIADGGVKVFEKVADARTRTGTGDHCEYFTKDDKVVLTGTPQFVDSQKGVTRGKQLTYYSDDDKLIVEGEPTREAFTRMKKK
jgi:lipopolysaccharide export system protein LptA